MKKPSLVIVLMDSNGMDQIVSIALWVKFGILLQELVSVLLELNGIINSAQLSKIVSEECFGIKILGHANVHRLQFGMEITVFLILVLVEKYGIISQENVFVLETELI